MVLGIKGRDKRDLHIVMCEEVKGKELEGDGRRKIKIKGEVLRVKREGREWY